MVTPRSRTLGPDARPVAVLPDKVEPAIEKARGTVVLPLHVRWSGPEITYDLANRSDRIRVYEQVMREGTEEDVLHFIDPEQLVEVWDHLVLPSAVRAAWATWLETRASEALPLE
jgi:hypothetical protein